MIAALDAAARLGRRQARGQAQLRWLAARPGLAAPSPSAKPVYERRFGEPPIVTAVHAGLETAVIGTKVPGLDMLSFGPQIEFPHSPDERVSIPTVERFWRLLVARRRRAVGSGEGRRACADRSPGSSAIVAGVVLVIVVTAADRRPRRQRRDRHRRRVGTERLRRGRRLARSRWRRSSRTSGRRADHGGRRGAAVGDPAEPDGFVREGLERARSGDRDPGRRHRPCRDPGHAAGRRGWRSSSPTGPTPRWRTSRRRRTRSTRRRTPSRSRSSSSPRRRERSPSALGSGVQTSPMSRPRPRARSCAAGVEHVPQLREETS